MEEKHVCPVCGWPGLLEEAYSPGSRPGILLGSYEICSCCRYEYGVTDADRGITQEHWRQQWIDEGTPWRSTEEDPPAEWDPRAQLRSIGYEIPSE